MKRREFITTAAATTIGAILAPNLARAEEIKINKLPFESAKAFSTEFKAKPLGFDPKKLNGLSEKMIQSHWENNYMGSVKALNGVKKKLIEIATVKDAAVFLYAGLKREHLMRTGSVIYHDMYFGNLGGNGKAGTAIQKNIAATINKKVAGETDKVKPQEVSLPLAGDGETTSPPDVTPIQRDNKNIPEIKFFDKDNLLIYHRQN